MEGKRVLKFIPQMSAGTGRHSLIQISLVSKSCRTTGTINTASQGLVHSTSGHAARPGSGKAWTRSSILVYQQPKRERTPSSTALLGALISLVEWKWSSQNPNQDSDTECWCGRQQLVLLLHSASPASYFLIIVLMTSVLL